MNEKFMNKMDDMELDMVAGGRTVHLVTVSKNELGMDCYYLHQGNYDGDVNELDELAKAGKTDEIIKKVKMRDSGWLNYGKKFIDFARSNGSHVIVVRR